MRPSLRSILACILATIVTLPGIASAHGVDLQHFRPTAGGQGLYGIDRTTTLEPWVPAFGLSFSYAQGPLRLEAGGAQAELSQYQAVSYLHLRLGVLRWLDIGADLPFAVGQAGSSISGALDTELRSTGLGDLRIDPRVRLLDPAKAPLGLALALPVTLPTGLESDYLGEHGVTFNPQVLAGGNAGRLEWAASLGYRLRPAIDIYYFPLDTTLTLGNELTYGAALDLMLVGPLHLATELEGRFGFLPGAVDDPLEARLGIRVESKAGLTAQLGGAIGLTEGYGASGWRGFAGVGYAWDVGRRRVYDLDGDGLVDKDDRCPKEPEDKDSFEDQDGCPDPDNDRDGIADAQDRCPLAAEVLNDLEDTDGCPDALPDTDGDGIADARDGCPSAAEDKDGFRDGDGCPEPDNDEDGVADAADKCPDAPETRNSLLDEDGCPDEAPSPQDGGAGLPSDADGDEVPDSRDRCPKEPELRNGIQDDDGCPEQDQDGDAVVDWLDKCPSQPESRNAFQDDDGCPEPDTDGDGIVDGRDACPKRFETRNGFQDDDGCPEADTDGDGLIDGLDRCPKQPETVNGENDFDGCPEVDTDGDGIPDGRDKCPNKPEMANRFEDEDGCPEPDSDGDGIIDGLDKCPREVETANGYQDDDGCPDQRPGVQGSERDHQGRAPSSPGAALASPGLDTDSDGIPDPRDKCPKKPEVRNGYQDDDGCPEFDWDKDGIFDGLDKCPGKAETLNGYQDQDGCPDKPPAEQRQQR